MENNQEYIDELIARCLEGNPTRADIDALEAWKSADPENEKYYKDAAFIYNAASRVTINHDVNTDAAWQKISGQMGNKSIPDLRAQTLKENFKYSFRMAAVVVFLIGISFVWYIATHPSGNQGQILNITANLDVVKKTLPDGSKVIVKSGSSLVALQNEKAKTREYKLSGQAKFTVVHNDKEPFIIHADNTLIKDIGTVFNVNTMPGMDTIMVTVESGIVKFYAENKEGLLLNAGEKGYYSKSKGLFSIFEVKKELDEIKFENATLEEVAEKLNAKYGMQIRFENEHIKSCRMSVKFSHSNPHDIIEIIKQTFSLQSKTENNIIILSGKGCE